MNVNIKAHTDLPSITDTKPQKGQRYARRHRSFEKISKLQNSEQNQLQSLITEQLSAILLQLIKEQKVSA